MTRMVAIESASGRSDDSVRPSATQRATSAACEMHDLVGDLRLGVDQRVRPGR